jgi:hypothetical protein
MPPSHCTVRSMSALLLSALAGCASPPVSPPAPDTSPQRPTAVQEAYISSAGLAGFFPFEGTVTTLTRADMRREDNVVKGTGTFSRFIIGTQADASILRLDRKLVWQLDVKRAEYTECPLGGCVQPGQANAPDPRQPAPPRAARDDGCKMRIASNTFTVKPTGTRRNINGFDTERYAVDWIVVLEDGKRRRSTSALNAEFWTSPMTAQMREAQAIEASFGRNALANSNARLPAQLQRSMSMFLENSLTAADKAALFNLGRQFDKIKGHPILMTLNWGFKGDACGGTGEGSAGAAGGPAGAAGVLGGILGGMTGGRANGSAGAAADRPLISMSHELRKYRVEPLRDSQFAPPPGYKRSNP